MKNIMNNMGIDKNKLEMFEKEYQIAGALKSSTFVDLTRVSNSKYNRLQYKNPHIIKFLLDHSQMFVTQNAQRILIAQPYEERVDDYYIQLLKKFTQAFSLSFEERSELSWYNAPELKTKLFIFKIIDEGVFYNVVSSCVRKDEYTKSLVLDLSGIFE